MSLALIITCKGRLKHLKQTLPLTLYDLPSDAEVIVVDHHCPDGTTDWVNAYLYRHPVVPVPVRDGDPYFNKVKCNNLGWQVAVERGAKHLLFIDADTVTSPEFFAEVLEKARTDRFSIVDPYQHNTDLTGILSCPALAMVESSGYDERFRNWGDEDIEMRLRLYAKHGFKFNLLSSDYLSSIPHGDKERTQFYQIKDRDESHQENKRHLKNAFFEATGKRLSDFHGTPHERAFRVLRGV